MAQSARTVNCGKQSRNPPQADGPPGLYKVRDSLTWASRKIGKGPNKFGVSAKRWRKFGRILNKEYDLRHAPPDPAKKREVSRDHKDLVFAIGREMITGYLDFKGLQHIP